MKNEIKIVCTMDLATYTHLVQVAAWPVVLSDDSTGYSIGLVLNPTTQTLAIDHNWGTDEEIKLEIARRLGEK